MRLHNIGHLLNGTPHAREMVLLASTINGWISMVDQNGYEVWIYGIGFNLPFFSWWTLMIMTYTSMTKKQASKQAMERENITQKRVAFNVLVSRLSVDGNELNDTRARGSDEGGKRK